MPITMNDKMSLLSIKLEALEALEYKRGFMNDQSNCQEMIKDIDEALGYQNKEEN